MNALIKIVGTQRADGEEDTIELTTNGTLERIGEGWKLCYNETEATGMEGTVTQLEICDGRLTLVRSGAHPSMLILEQNRRHHCNYQTPYGAIELGTYASKIVCKLDDDGGEVEFHYTLGFNGGVSSAHTVHITVQEEK